MNRQYNLYAFLAFLIGLGYKTQVYFLGCVGISEFFVFAVAPVIFFKNLSQYKRTGFRTIFVLLFLVMLGCLLSGWVNQSYYVAIVKSFAMIYATFATIVVFHQFLRVNPNGVGWYIFGYAISSVITIWAFHPKADIQVGYLGGVSTDIIVENVMFWIKKVREFAIIPVCLCYLKTPIAYSVTMPLAYSVYCMLVSVSGRSMALGTIGSGVLVLLGRKKRHLMASVGRHFLMLILIAIALIFVFKFAYKKAALAGVLGEESLRKYEKQSELGDSAWKILIRGRQEFFISLSACLEHPIWGLGPHALDVDGYVEDFMVKFGTEADLSYYRNAKMMMGGVPLELPCHSHITSFWLWFGIFGLIFWLYIIYLCIQYFRKFSSAVPQWYGYFSLSIPMLFWDMFFSPYNWRMNTGVLITALLCTRAVYNKTMRLPEKFEREALQYDRK